MFRYSEIVSLFQPPTTVKVLGIVGLSFRLLMRTTYAKLFKHLSEGLGLGVVKKEIGNCCLGEVLNIHHYTIV